jgi:rRNA-processing protein FCF1
VPPAERVVAVLDTDVLVPILSCDLLLCAFGHDLYQPVVTPMILTEVGRTLQVDFPHLDQDALARRADQVVRALAFHTHADAPLTEAVVGVNAKDRHVAAIALLARASLVVSNDRRLRRQINQLRTPLRAVTGDEFMLGLRQAHPDEVDAVIDTMVAKRTPPRHPGRATQPPRPAVPPVHHRRGRAAPLSR